MSKQAEGQPPQATRSMKQFDILIGEWNAVGTHPQLATPVHGQATFEWLKDGALLIWRFDWEQGREVPSAYSVIGHDDTSDVCTMLYSDVRGVSRIIQMTLADGVWKTWRNSEGFSQRSTSVFSDDGNTINSTGELSRDGSTWEGDLSVTFTRKK